MHNNLFLPENYKRRLEPEYFNDTTSKLHQPDVYTFAENLAIGFGAKKIIDFGCGNGDRIAKISSLETIGIDYGNNIQKSKASYPGKKWVESNFEEDLNHLSLYVKNGWIVCADVIEHLINPEILLDFFSQVLPEIYGIVISTPERDRARGQGNFGPPQNPSHVAEWAKEEFNLLLCSKNLKPLLHGFTRNVEDSITRETQIAFIPGGLLNFDKKEIKLLAVVPCFNEADVIENTIDNLLKQGIDVHVIDNWSTDGSWEKIQKYTNIKSERFPDAPDNQYNWTAILNRIDEVGYTSNYNWILHVDADEQIESPIELMSIKEFISFADFFKFDVIDFTHIAFRPTTSSLEPGGLSKFWQFGDSYGDRTLHRAWKNKKHSVHLSVYGGHVVPTASNQFPIRLILKHYSLRTPEQAKQKIFKNRLPRFIEEKRKGWHVHYDVFREDYKFVWNESELNTWNKETVDEWVVEITTKLTLPFSGANLPKGFN